MINPVRYICNRDPERWEEPLAQATHHQAPVPVETAFQRVISDLKSEGRYSHPTIIERLESYGALTQQERFDIAHYVATHHSAHYVCEESRLHLFGLTDQTLLYELALFVSKSAPSGRNAMINGIQHFKLNEEQRFKIALILVENGEDLPYFCLKFEANFALSNQNFIFQIVRAACKKYPTSFEVFISQLADGKEKEDLRAEVFKIACDTEKLFTEYSCFRGCFPEYEKKLKTLLPKLQHEISKQKNPLIKKSLEHWLEQQQWRLMFLFRGNVPPEIELLMQELMEYRNPDERHKISEMILTQFLRREDLETWLKIIPCNQGGKQIQTHALIPLAMFIRLAPNVYTKNPKSLEIYMRYAQYFSKCIAKERKVLRYGPHLMILARYILKLKALNVSSEKKLRLFSLVFYEGEEIVPRLRILSFFSELGKCDLLLGDKKPLSLKDLEVLKKKMMKEAFDINLKEFAHFDFLSEYEGDAFSALYEKEIEKKWRDPTAPLIYAGKIEELDSAEKEVVKKAYGLFIKSVLQGTLRKLRASSPHLRALAKKVPGGFELIQKWNALGLIMCPLQNYLPAEGVDKELVQKQFYEFLRTTLALDHHIDNWAQKFPFIARLLNNQKAENLFAEMAQLPPTVENEMQRAILSFCIEGDLGLLLKVREMVSKANFVQWTSDFDNFIKRFTSKKAIDDKWTIGLTDDPCDLMLLARETGGCQSIDGMSSSNKCALGYMMDGKNIPIYVRSSDGTLKARAILRLLYHEKLERPVIFMERHYNMGDARLSQALNALAKEVASRLNLDIVQADDGSQPYPDGLVSFGSNAPFEYSDAGGGEIRGGVFRIDNLYTL